MSRKSLKPCCGLTIPRKAGCFTRKPEPGLDMTSESGANQERKMMNLLSKEVFLFILICSFSIGQAADLTQDQFVNFMTKNMPALFCKPGQYYLDCYEVVKEACEDTAAFAVDACISNHMQELPDIFTYDESRKWGGIIENCVDAEYSRAFSNQKKDTQECNEIK